MPVEGLYSEPPPAGLVRGRIANAPADSTASLYVVIPSFDSTAKWGPVVWSPKGGTLPQQGADCLVGFDDGRIPWLVTWAGAWTAPAAAGAAGGDLSGSFPNPTVAHVLGGATPLAIDSLGKSLALQLLSAQQLQIQVGNSTVTTSAGPVGTLVVNHSIGRTPWVLATADPSVSGSSDVVATVASRTTTQFTLGVYAAGQGGSWGYRVDWAAIG